MTKNGYVFINNAGLYAKEITNITHLGPAKQIVWVELKNATVFSTPKHRLIPKYAQAIQAQEQRSVVLAIWDTEDEQTV